MDVSVGEVVVLVDVSVEVVVLVDGCVGEVVVLMVVVGGCVDGDSMRTIWHEIIFDVLLEILYALVARRAM